MKTRTKIFVSIIAILLCCVLLFTFVFLNRNKESVNRVSANSRTIELSSSALDVQSVFDEFEDATLTKNGNTIYFEGFRTLDKEKLSEIDYISETDYNELENSVTKYNFSYNSETNTVTLSAMIQLLDGSIEIDELSGVGFINEKNEVDAVMNVEGESVLLSEMREAGLIENCGWFSKLIKKIVKAVVVVAVAAVVVTAAVAVSVATAGAASAAIVAAGVGMTSTAISAAGATVGIVAGALFTATAGKAAIQAGTAIGEDLGECAEQIVDKATGRIIAFIWNGIEYIMQKLTDALRYEMRYGGYRIAALDKDESCVYVSVTIVGFTVAVNLLKAGNSVYNYESNGAYNAAKSAGGGLTPDYHSPHDINKKTGELKRGIFYEHWHVHGHFTNGHSFFGIPVIH